MDQRKLSRWVRCILAAAGVCGLIVYALVVPRYGLGLRQAYPEFANRFYPWLIFIWLSGAPCFAVLALGWRIAAGIGAGRAFTRQNARYLQWISMLAAADAAFFFAGNLLLFLLDMSHPAVLLASLAVVFAGVAVAVGAAVLSHLAQKAAALQEQSDLTI